MWFCLLYLLFAYYWHRTLIIYRYQRYGSILKVASGGHVQRSLPEVWTHKFLIIKHSVCCLLSIPKHSVCHIPKTSNIRILIGLLSPFYSELWYMLFTGHSGTWYGIGYIKTLIFYELSKMTLEFNSRVDMGIPL